MSEDDDEKRLEGTISEGDLESDFSGEVTNEETKEEDNKEEEGENTNMDEEKDPIVEAPEESSDAPVEESAPVEEVAEESVEETTVVEASTEEPEQETPKEEVEAAPAAEPSVIPVQKKKSKKGLIIFLIIFAILLIGGGVGFAIWMSIHESPEVALKDALSDFWSSENVQLNGDIVTASADTETTFTVDAIKAGAKISGSGVLKADYNGQEVKLNFSAAYVDKGAAYIKFEGLKDFAKDFDFDSIFSALSGTNESAMDFSSLISSIIGGLAERVDGNWYKIEANDVKGINGGEQMSCILENLNGILSSDSKDEVVNAYKENSFLEIDKDAKVTDKDGAKVYTIKIDKTKRDAFGDKVKEIDAYKKLSKCTESEDTVYEIDDEDPLDVEDEEDDEDDEDRDISAPKRTTAKKEAEVELKLSIAPWTHKLVGIEFTEKNDDDDKTSADLKLSYDKKDVEEPSDAKSIKTLESDFKEILTGAAKQMVTELCTSFYGDYGEEFINACVEQALQSENFNSSNILQQFLGGSSDIEDCTDEDGDDC